MSLGDQVFDDNTTNNEVDVVSPCNDCIHQKICKHYADMVNLTADIHSKMRRSDHSYFDKILKSITFNCLHHLSRDQIAYR